MLSRMSSEVWAYTLYWHNVIGTACPGELYVCSGGNEGFASVSKPRYTGQRPMKSHPSDLVNTATPHAGTRDCSEGKPVSCLFVCLSLSLSVQSLPQLYHVVRDTRSVFKISVVQPWHYNESCNCWNLCFICVIWIATQCLQKTMPSVGHLKSQSMSRLHSRSHTVKVARWSRLVSTEFFNQWNMHTKY